MSTEKIYKGIYRNGSAVVTVNGTKLRPRYDVRDHSPTGFSWGYGGSGPAQLALAILLHYLRDKEKALHYYQDFKWEVIAKLPEPPEGFVMTNSQIDAALSSINARATKEVLS